MDELAGLKLRDLGYQEGKQRVGGDVERHPQKDIGAALKCDGFAGIPGPGTRGRSQCGSRDAV